MGPLPCGNDVEMIRNRKRQRDQQLEKQNSPILSCFSVSGSVRSRL